MLTAEGASASSSGDLHPQMYRKIELYPPKRHYNAITASLGDFPVETLNLSISEASRAVPGGSVRVVKVETSTQERRSVAGVFYEHGFDPELTFRISYQKIGAGLENLGNTCYLNSVLQCLTYTEPFAAYLQSGKHKSTCRNTGFCAMCALQNHVMDVRQSPGKILRPFHLVKNLRCISRNFRYSRQEDAHEYMVNLLESMHKCCLPYGVQSESPSAYEKSQVHKIFGGQLRSQVKCEQCSYCSNKFDPFLDLSLEIMKADSLSKALEHFTAMELLDGGERQYQCQRCEEKVRASKQLTVHKAPYVLTIHLKRFGSTVHGEKLSKKVEYGPTLDLNPFISEPHEGGYNYTLYGVLVHAGWSTHSGHYFCYVRTSVGMWYSLDDNQVTQVSEKTVLSREAYMLFYVRNRTFAVKRPVVISSSKSDISASVDGNNVAPMMESEPTATVYSHVLTMNDGTPSEFVSSTCTSLQKSAKNEGLLLHAKDNVETKCSCMEVVGDVFANKREITASKDPKKSPISTVSNLSCNGDQKCDNVSESAQDNVLAHKLETNHQPYGGDVEEIEGSILMNDSVQKEAVDTRVVEKQNSGQGDHELLSCSTNQQPLKDGENFMKTMEIDSLLPIAAVYCVQQVIPVDIITKKLFHQSESKLKKLRKISSAKGPYFGRKHLFLMSLHLPKGKHLRLKKHLTSRNKRNNRKIDSNTDLHEASTSEAYQTIDEASRHPPSKHSHSIGCRNLKRSHHEKNGRSSVHDEEFRSMNSVKFETSNKSSALCFTGNDNMVNGKNAKDADIRNFSVNSLMAPLKETPVARWVDENIQVEQVNEIKEYTKRNLGYILDEWDENYGKGRRKKVKKSRQWFGVGAHNPFHKAAIFKGQHRSKVTVQRKSSCNLPFRI